MPGERTPDQTPKMPHNTDNDISLREHMQRQLDVILEGAQLRLAGLRTHTDQEINHVNDRISELVAARAALAIEQDRRYEQRFVAQEQAVQLALARVDKEFHEHLQSARNETLAALLAADKAISKSESATEKRFESVNEFRAQLQDQATRFMPRAEAEQRIGQNAEKISTMESRFILDIQNLTSRLDKNQGQEKGADRSRELLGWLVGLGATLLTIYFATKGG